MLDELQDHVESIDAANGKLNFVCFFLTSCHSLIFSLISMNRLDLFSFIVIDLHTIGGLVPLLGYLNNSNAGIRAKAADVITTIVQNNPKGQQLVMEASGMEPLFRNFSSDSDVSVRTKALGAISCKCD